MPPVYTYDHIHLRTTNPQATIEFYQKMFDATPVAYVQSNGKPRVDLDLNGLTIFIAEVPADAALPTAPAEPYIGLDHLGLRVDEAGPYTGSDTTSPVRGWASPAARRARLASRRR